MTPTRPISYITAKELDDSFILVEEWDPKFWEKATHALVDSEYVNSSGSVKCNTHYTYYHKVDKAYSALTGGNGYVYILLNANMPGICKIGSTTRSPEDRLKEINNGTGVIIPFTLHKAFRCKAPLYIENIVHETLAKVRVNKNKEGFYIAPEEAEKTILDTIKTAHAEV